MLDVIADFWKPVKKVPPQEKLQESQLQIGSSIGFGFVPQALLSGRRLSVSSINTYQFGIETLTSFVLSQDRDPSVSMIIAESEGEQYLAISRRVPLEERLKLFDTFELENILAKPDATRLYCKDNVAEFKSWLVGSYKREIQGLKGRIYKGDYRKLPLPATSEGQEFEYTLLVSDSNEHAIEIEKYTDGRLEVYATIYRRINDVGEITHPASELVLRPEIKLATKRDDVAPTAAAPAAPAPVLLEPVQVLKPAEKPAAPVATLPANDVTAEVKAELKAETKQAAPVAQQPAAPVAQQPVATQPAAPITMTGAQFGVVSTTAMPVSAPVTPAVQPTAPVVNTAPISTPNAAVNAAPVVAAPKAETKIEVKPEVKAESKIEVKPEPKAEAKVEAKAPEVKVETKPAEVKPQATVAAPVVAAAPAAEPKTVEPKAEAKPAVAAPVAAAAPIVQKEKTTMPNPELAAVNGVHADAAKPTLYVHNNPEASAQQSVKAVSRPLSQFDNDSIECDLRVANKLIDEAIRNEMRLNDVVRRVIELPVANPESVQIPVTLTDEDYSLLAIRYGIPASDRNAIKRRIIEDLNDFSGEKK